MSPPAVTQLAVPSKRIRTVEQRDCRTFTICSKPSSASRDFVVSNALIELYKDGVINKMRLSAGTSFSSIAAAAVNIAVSTASPVPNVAPVTV